MWWFLLQGSIVFAVMASNIHWQWTPNGYLAGLIGTGMAFLATVAINRIVRKSGVKAVRNGDSSEYQLENDSRFLRRIKQARASLRAGRGVRLEDVEK